MLREELRDASVWELDGEELERVGDLSPNGAFGRCLVYRVDVSQLLKVGVVLALMFTKRNSSGKRPGILKLK